MIPPNVVSEAVPVPVPIAVAVNTTPKIFLDAPINLKSVVPKLVITYVCPITTELAMTVCGVVTVKNTGRPVYNLVVPACPVGVKLTVILFEPAVVLVAVLRSL